MSMKTATGKMKQQLENNGCTFEKAPDGLSYVCYMGTMLVADKRTLGECVWEAAQELGEKAE